MNLTPERRLQPRIVVAGAPAKVAPDGALRRRRVRLVDLSVDGVCWRGTALAAGQRVTLSIPTGRFLGSPIRLAGVVVRQAGGDTAAQFLPGDDRARLHAYLQRAQLRMRAATDVGLADSAAIASAFEVLGAGLGHEGATRIVMVASPGSADGKSFVVGGLASSLVLLGRRVLVVDADFRSPLQHLQFGAKGSPGLAQLLAEPTTERASAIIQQTRSGVALLAAGAVSLTAGARAPETVARLGTSLRELNYHVILIDSAPVLSSAESLLFSRIADETFLTVRSGATREREVQSALAVLRRNGTAAAGVVLNDYRGPLAGRRLPSRAGAPGGTDAAGVTPVSDAMSPMPVGRLIV